MAIDVTSRRELGLKGGQGEDSGSFEICLFPSAEGAIISCSLGITFLREQIISGLEHLR